MLRREAAQGFGSPSGAGLSCMPFLYSCTLSWKLGSSKASAMNSSVLQVSVVSLQRKITWVTQGALHILPANAGLDLQNTSSWMTLGEVMRNGSLAGEVHLWR